MKLNQAEIAAATIVVRTSGWLSGTDQEFQDAILARANWLAFETGATISHGGDAVGGMFGLARGAMSVLPAIGAPDMPAIHIFGAPYWYGTNPMLEGLPRSVSMIAREPCVVAAIPQYALSTLLAERPDWWRWIAVSVSATLGLVSQIAVDLQIRDSRRRCIAVLLRLAERRHGGDGSAVALVGQDELAGMANMSRQTIGPILRDLADTGTIGVGYRSITLHDPAALRAIVDN